VSKKTLKVLDPNLLLLNVWTLFENYVV